MTKKNFIRYFYFMLLCFSKRKDNRLLFPLNQILFLFGLICCSVTFAQHREIDSMNALFALEKQDSNKVTLLWNLADAYNKFNPDTGRILAQQAVELAKKIKFTEGESISLGKLANSYNKMGNYPKALEYYLLKLKLEENRSNPQNMANVLLNIGTVYVYQDEYDKALPYYYQADSIMKSSDGGDFKSALILRYSIQLNIGDLYTRLNKLDSAILYFQRSLVISNQQDNLGYTGMSMLGLGEVELKLNNYEKAKFSLKGALSYLETAHNEEMVCEASWSLASLYDSLNQKDSVKYFAQKMLLLAQKDGFLSWHQMAADLLDGYYRKEGKFDSAYTYRVMSQQLKDSISSRAKIRQSQIISSNELIRQADLADQKRKSKKERTQQLQFLFIGIFIPALFLITLMLSRRKIHIRVIKFMGIISLLIFFEYLTLLLHPYVLDITHHTPIYELLIFVVIAAFVIRAHHRIEAWFIDKLISRNQRIIAGRGGMLTEDEENKKPPDNIST